jgi:sulfite reductase beta subunit-like hemoprotein
MSTMLRIEAIKDLIQEAVDKGATTVEQIHKVIADLPFSVLEQRGLLDDSAEAVRDTSARTIGSVYDAIRRINREIGEMASHVIEAVDDQIKVQRDIGARDRSRPER